ncbi:MAG: hypothetical protein NZM10_05755, partial [Fimbriimonadales bacterium]|nr:hypothetical protein [Fimbriimonadales bacterium]
AYRAVGWIPGRTTTLMTLFALLALVGTCQYVRTGLWRWGLLGLLGFLGALMSHEQAVMLPLLMALVGWACAHTPQETAAPAAPVRNGLRRALVLSLLCLLMLVPYGMFYRARIPIETEYHQQRLRRFKMVPVTALHWLVPTARESLLQLDLARTAPMIAIFPGFWLAQLGLVVYLIAWREGVRTRLGWAGWLGSLLAYAPLLPVLPLMHYYYLPAVFRALWAGILLLCLLTLRPTRRATSVATGDAMCPKRSFPR